jgi:hypothetical protein
LSSAEYYTDGPGRLSLAILQSEDAVDVVAAVLQIFAYSVENIVATVKRPDDAVYFRSGHRVCDTHPTQSRIRTTEMAPEFGLLVFVVAADQDSAGLQFANADDGTADALDSLALAPGIKLREHYAVLLFVSQDDGELSKRWRAC